MGVDVSKYSGELIPVIFRANFRDPGGYFLATNLQMRNQDIIFVANSSSVEVTKFLNYLNTIINTGNNAVVAGSNAIILRNQIKALKGT